MSEYRYIDLRAVPALRDTAAEWFHSKWGVAKEAYLACMDAYLNCQSELGWYLCLHDDRIIGGMGVIENDFHDRKDLTPNGKTCTLFSSPEFSGGYKRRNRQLESPCPRKR